MVGSLCERDPPSLTCIISSFELYFHLLLQCRYRMTIWFLLFVMHAQFGEAEDVYPPYSVTMPSITDEKYWNLSRNATYNSTRSSILLNPGETYAAGLALTQKRFTLLRDNNSSVCESASFQVSFSFRIYDLASYYGDGMSLALLGGNFNLDDYRNNSYRTDFSFYNNPDDAKNVGGFAVEFDTWTGADVRDSIKTPHVGIDLNYNVTSVISEKLTNVNLLDESVKYAWIDYDGGIQILSIFVDGNNKKPASPLISYSLNLCQIFRPPKCGATCENISSVYFLFVSNCGDAYEAHELLSFNLNITWDSESKYVDVATPWSYNPDTFDSSLWNLYGNASGATSSLALSNGIADQTGVAIFRKRITVLNGTGSLCVSASFQIKFLFKISDKADNSSAGDGISFVILSPLTDIPNYVNSIGKLGSSFKGNNRFSLYGAAVEFDSSDNIARLKLNFSAIAKVRLLQEASIDLSDTSVKYAWIVHDRDTKILSLFVGKNSTQPDSAFLSTSIDLCSLLRPEECSECQQETAAYLIMASTTSSDRYATHELLTFAVNTSWEPVSNGLNPSPSPLYPPTSLIPPSPLPSQPPPSLLSSRGSNYTLVIVVGGAAAILIIIAAAVFCFLCNRPKAKSMGYMRPHGINLAAPALNGEVVDVGNGRFTRRFTLDEVMAATDNFSEDLLLGKGGFGSVYVGTFSEGEKWAVKQSHQRLSTEQTSTFETEVKLIACVSHRNLVALKGFCDEDGEQILVYEFVPNGNLRQLIEGQSTGNNVLSMEDRIQIAAGAARGLDYLHHFEMSPIIHCDVKSENILIGDNLTAKVADFGLLKSVDISKTHVSADVMGTLGYLDPEYVRTLKVSTKSDVYSFGVVLLEIVTGRRCNFISLNEEDEDESTYESIVAWAKRTWHQDNVTDFVDPFLESNYHPNIVNRIVQLALHCTKFEGRLRPSMRDVLNILEEIEHENRVMSGQVGSKYDVGAVGLESRPTSDGSGFGSGSNSDISKNSFVSFVGAPVSHRPTPK